MRSTARSQQSAARGSESGVQSRESKKSIQEKKSNNEEAKPQTSNNKPQTTAPINKEHKKELQKQQRIFQQLEEKVALLTQQKNELEAALTDPCLLYTSDAADERSS